MNASCVSRASSALSGLVNRSAATPGCCISPLPLSLDVRLWPAAESLGRALKPTYNPEQPGGAHAIPCIMVRSIGRVAHLFASPPGGGTI